MSFETLCQKCGRQRTCLNLDANDDASAKWLERSSPTCAQYARMYACLVSLMKNLTASLVFLRTRGQSCMRAQTFEHMSIGCLYTVHPGDVRRLQYPRTLMAARPRRTTPCRIGLSSEGIGHSCDKAGIEDQTPQPVQLAFSYACLSRKSCLFPL